MALEVIKNINIDFYDKKYVLINAKQYDDRSRWIVITCYNQGNLFNLSANEHSAYVKYKKADGHGVLNYCRINNKGEILVELTEQMLAAGGICYVDLVIVNKGSAMVNVNTGEIITIDESPILSTMAFCVKVYETTIDNSEIESSYEYDALNELLGKVEAEYTEVIQLSKSYAVGNAGGIRDNEDKDNAKYYYEQNLISHENISISEQNAKTSETNAKTSEINAKTSETNAYTSETNAKASETNAKASETNALVSEQNAKESETNAKISETNALDYSIISQRYAIGGTNTVQGEDTDNSKYYYEKSFENANNANESDVNALASANFSKSYAVGGTDTRENEDKDNAKYYCEVVKSVVDNLSSGFIPIGTISFSELAIVEKATGFTYNIRDDFTTDDTFREGAGKSYTAGTNVYCCSDGMWDCLGGSASPTATVDEVKTFLGI